MLGYNKGTQGKGTHINNKFKTWQMRRWHKHDEKGATKQHACIETRREHHEMEE
jgi:hypothetical protein